MVAQGPPGTSTGAGDSSFRTNEIGLFDPDLDPSYGAGDIVHSGTDTYLRDVHIFTDRIRDAAAIQGNEFIRNKIPSCLRGTALE